MAKLTSKERNSLPKSDFGLPEQEAYPMPDANHARLAKSGASRAEHVGHITKAQEASIDRKADKVLGKKSDPPAHWSNH